MKPKANELAAGLFVLAMLVCFLVFLSWIGGGFERWFAETQPAVTWFRNIGGLKEKVIVVYQGLPIGDVNTIAYDREKKLIRVEMALIKGFDLPEKGIATITTASLLGDPYIEITQQYSDVEGLLIRGDDRIQMVNGKVEIDAIDPASFGMIQVQLQRFLSKADGHVDELADSMGRVLTGVDLLVSDTQFRSDIHTTAANFRIASMRLPGAMNDAEAFLKSANSAASKVDGIMTRSEDTIYSIIRNVDEIGVNARVLSYGVARNPSMLVWGDKDWQAKFDRRDSEVLEASLRKPAVFSSGPASAPSASPTGAAPRGGNMYRNF